MKFVGGKSMPDKNYNLSDLEIAFQKIRDGVSLEGKSTTKKVSKKENGMLTSLEKYVIIYLKINK
jgi:hypothetical protein